MVKHLEKKKKILIVQETLEGGGAEKVLIDILNNIKYSKYDVDLLLIKNTGVYIDQINENVNKKYIYNKSKIVILDKIKDKIFKKIIIKYFCNFFVKNKIESDYYAEIAFLEGPSSQIVSKLKNKNSKKIGWVHTDLRKLRRITKKEEKVIYSRFDKIVCVSNEVKNALVSLYPFTEEKSKVIYNLIDMENIKKRAKQEIKFNFDGKNIVSVGRLIDSKRFDLIIKAHKEVIDKGIKHNLIILGEGPLKHDLINLADRLGVSNSVKFIGFVKNPYPYIAKADIYVMASDYEGLPLVICEALVLNKVIISTDCTGPLELLSNGSGILVKRGEYKEIANNIINILKNQNEGEKFKDSIKCTIEKFDTENIMNQIYNVID